jgi:hypothetical protein
MFDLENTAVNLTFGEFITQSIEYLRPFAPMWPFCWLKAVAVHQEDSWRLAYLSLSGRWSERKPKREFHDVSTPLYGRLRRR